MTGSRAQGYAWGRTISRERRRLAGNRITSRRDAGAPRFALLSMLILAAAFLLIPRLGSAQYQLSARAEPSRVSAGETVVYSVVITYGQQPPPSPIPPIFKPEWGFSSPEFAGTASSKQIIWNQATQANQVTETVEYNWHFSVSKDGTYQIPPVWITMGGRRFESNPVTLTVSKAPTVANVPAELQGLVVPPRVPRNPQLQNAINGGIFIYPYLEKRTFYEGEQIVLSYFLTVDPPILEKAGLNPSSRMQFTEIAPPELKQFLKDEIFPIPRQQFNFREQELGGHKYMAASLYQVAITPTKTGKLAIDPFRIAIAIPSRSRSNRMPSLFDDPFSDMDGFPFGVTNMIQVIALSPQLELDIKPLPKQGRPADFTGAVGDYSVQTSIDKQQAVADEEIVNLSVKIEGHGDAGSLSKPPLPKMDGLKVLEEPKSSVQKRTENDHLISTKTFDYILRPEKPGDLVIPPVSLSVFSPEHEQYVTVQSQPLTVHVTPSTNKQVAVVVPPSATPSGAGASPAGNQEKPREIAHDIRYIHDTRLNPIEPGALTGEGPLFLLLMIGPPVLVVTGYYAGRRRRAMQLNRGYYREIFAGSVARKHLRKTTKLARAGNSGMFYDELSRAIRGYFGDKFHVNPAGLTIEQIVRELETHGAEPEITATATRLLEQCDQARYSPVQPTAEVMNSALTDAASLIDQVEKLK